MPDPVDRSLRVLVAGIGNIFCGDDAFGSEVARRLQKQKWPPGVQVVDFGIRGIDLTYALLDMPKAAIMIDALPRGAEPGTLFVIRPEVDASGSGPEIAPLDAHALDPLKVLRQVRQLGGALPELVLVGCQPGELGGDSGRMGLSAPVLRALPEAERLVTRLVHELLLPESRSYSDNQEK